MTDTTKSELLDLVKFPIFCTQREHEATLLGRRGIPQLCSAISLICCSLAKIPGLGKSEAEHMAIPELENEPLGNCSRQKNLHKASRCFYKQKNLKDFCIPASELPEHRWGAVHVPPTVRHGNEIIFPQNRNQKESSWNDRAKALHLS